MKKRWLAALVCLVMCLPMAAQGEINPDHARNFYEIFVYSYYDTDGDRIGDLNGVTQKLDYIKDMGFNGIWLMPIMPSPSYHKYDVTDYYAIDPLYGTLEDFENLIAQAHERDIWVIIDLVLNHTSNQHPYFQSAWRDENSPYRAFYNFSDSSMTGYNKIGDIYYESRFTTTMPDLNLDNQAVLDEIERIMQFWFDMGVDGFRLDACTSFYTGQRDKNVAFLKWLNDTAKRMNPDAYIVGEAWEDLYEIAAYYESGIDAFFCFPVSQQEGYISRTLSASTNNPGKSFGNVLALLDRNLPGVLQAPFICNHDTARAASFLRTEQKVKMAAGLLSLMQGSIYVYYGDEIGMTGSGNDPNKRIGMFFTTRSEITRVPPGATVADYPFPSVLDQEQDENSILHYYKAAMNLRLKYPEIALGENIVLPCEDGAICLMKKAYQGEEVFLVLNLSSQEKAVPLPESVRALSVQDTLLTTPEGITREGDTLIMPPMSVAYLK